MLITPILPILFSATLLQSAGPDRVTLTAGGKVLEGRVVFEGADEIVLRVHHTDKRIARKDVAEIRSLERSLEPIIDRDLAGADAVALESLAKECDAAGLAAEAKNLWLRVLLADPKNDAAVKALDAQRIKDEIKVALGKDRRKLTEFAERQKSWKDAYEITTTHFVVRSDLELGVVLDLAFGLERFYKRFYATLGDALELYVFDEAPEVHIFARAAEFPVAPVKGDTIWFAPGINQLHVLAESEPHIGAVVHELSKLMLFNALRRSAGATAQVPQWTVIGIAELFAKAAPSVRMGPWSELGKPDVAAFAVAQRADMSFERVFNASANDFGGDPKSAEMIPTAYTMVHFFVFAKDGAMRPGYGKFLREGAKGKISMHALTAAVAMDAKELGSAWESHVQAHAQ